MEDYKRRIIDERKELLGKKDKLTDFMHTDAYSELDSVNQGLLMVQSVAMKNYEDALYRRIELF